MKIIAGVFLSVVSFAGATRLALADDAGDAIVAKGIKAIGGEAKVAKAAGLSRKMKGTINFGGMESEFSGEWVFQGIDRYKSEFNSEFGGNKFQAVTVFDGKKGWRKFGDTKLEIDENGAATEKRNAYLQLTPQSVWLLKNKDFAVEAAGEEKVGDKPALVVKVTGPDKKDFKLSFDKESGLPLKVVATVLGFMGEEFTQETLYSNYKDFDGVKQATKIEVKRDGETFVSQEVTEFKLLEKVDPKTFAEPE